MTRRVDHHREPPWEVVSVGGKPEPEGGWSMPEYRRVRLVESSPPGAIVTDHMMDVRNKHPAENYDLFGVRWVAESHTLIEEDGETILVVSVVPDPK